MLKYVSKKKDFHSHVYIHVCLTLMLQEGQTAAELAREAGYDYIAKYIESTATAATTNGVHKPSADGES
jgi:hypothetical protein